MRVHFMSWLLKMRNLGKQSWLRPTSPVVRNGNETSRKGGLTYDLCDL